MPPLIACVHVGDLISVFTISIFISTIYISLDFRIISHFYTPGKRKSPLFLLATGDPWDDSVKGRHFCVLYA
jgi:hypothetical protein